MKSTLRDRLREAKLLQTRTSNSIISYEIVCNIKDELPIDLCRTIEEARGLIYDINEEYIKMDGRGIKLYIRPIVIDKDSGKKYN